MGARVAEAAHEPHHVLNNKNFSHHGRSSKRDGMDYIRLEFGVLLEDQMQLLYLSHVIPGFQCSQVGLGLQLGLEGLHSQQTISGPMTLETNSLSVDDT